jgi:triacylglycerol lipase
LWSAIAVLPRSSAAAGIMGGMLSSLAPARRRLVLVLLGGLVVIVVAGAAFAVAGLRGGDSAGSNTPVAQDVVGPVLLVPGYGGSITSLNVLATKLRSAGRDVTVVSLPDNAEGDLAAQATVLGVAVQAALTRTKAASVDIVGYSAGGVVTRLWLANDHGGSLTRRVVTLGSPQHGTELATLGALFSSECPVACQQLAPDSALLAKLNGAGAAGTEIPAGPTFVSFYTSHDSVVVPPESAVLKGALNIEIQQVCATSTVTHTQLPSDKLVDAMVAAELGAGNPVALTAADCTRLSS